MGVPTIEELNTLHSHICQALGDPKRIQIMYLLHDAPRNVTMIAESLDLPQPTVSRHLAILKQRGLVFTERNGAAVVYRLADARIIDVLEVMRQLLRDTLLKQASTLSGGSEL